MMKSSTITTYLLLAIFIGGCDGIEAMTVDGKGGARDLVQNLLSNFISKDKVEKVEIVNASRVNHEIGWISIKMSNDDWDQFKSNLEELSKSPNQGASWCLSKSDKNPNRTNNPPKWWPTKLSGFESFDITRINHISEVQNYMSRFWIGYDKDARLIYLFIVEFG